MAQLNQALERCWSTSSRCSWYSMLSSLRSETGTAVWAEHFLSQHVERRFQLVPIGARNMDDMLDRFGVFVVDRLFIGRFFAGDFFVRLIMRGRIVFGVSFFRCSGGLRLFIDAKRIGLRLSLRRGSKRLHDLPHIAAGSAPPESERRLRTGGTDTAAPSATHRPAADADVGRETETPSPKLSWFRASARAE